MPVPTPRPVLRLTVGGVAVALVASMILSGLAVTQPQPVAAVEPSDSGRYIVLLADSPLAAYGGGVNGLAATDPNVTGDSRLDADSAASRAYLAYLRTRQDAALAAINAALGRSVKVVFRYDTALNGLAVEISQAEAGRVAALARVTKVIADTELELVTDNGPAWIGAPSVWDGGVGVPGTKGEGIVAGIIDTGINHDHPSFADVGADGYDHTNPKGQYFGVCAAAGVLLCNDKLIGMYDFTGVGTGPEDDNGHGSHTASTTAGNVVQAGLVAPTITITRPASGVAPHANIIAYKACFSTPARGGCLQTSTVASIDQAVADGVDVINFSIGGTSRDPYGDGNALAFLNAQRAGVFLAVSAGNSGPGASTIGSPADAPWVTAVAASTHDRVFTNSLVDLTGGTNAPGDMVGRSVTSGYGPAEIVYAGDYSADGSGLCGAPFPPDTFDGEIVICDRGVNPRVEKASNVKAGGAGGFVLANDAPSGDSLVADAYSLPGVHVTYRDGLALKAWVADGGASHTGTITGTVADEADTYGDVMASFSSRGPNPFSGDVLKPNVTAPGVDILAAFHTPAGGTGSPAEYNVISGTSMSSPHTAGSAALLRDLHPDWTPDEVRSALMTTSVTDVRKEDAATQADPFDYGGGRVALRRAAAAGLVFNETADAYVAANPTKGGNLTTLNIPALSDGDCPGACSWIRTARATGNGAGTWTAAVSVPDGMTISVAPSTFTLAAGETASFKVTADVTGLEQDRWYFATVTLTSSGGAPAVHLPVAVFVTAGGASVGAAPVLTDPGTTNTTGSYDLTWSDVEGEVGYRVQQSTDFKTAFSDDAEAGRTGKWTTEAAPGGGWLTSDLRSKSPDSSYTSVNTDEKTSTLTLEKPLSVPAGAEATIRFASFEDTEPDFDYGYVEASDDGGATWETLLTINGHSGGEFVERAATATGLSGQVSFRFRYVTDELISAPLYEGWYVDDITIQVGSWTSIGDTAADVTRFAVTGQANGTYYHRVAGLFDTGAAEPVAGPWSNVVDMTVNRPVADLSLTNSDSPDPVLAGAKVTYTLIARNSGPAAATGVTITDTLPASVSFVSASTGCSNVSGTVTCTVGSLASGASESRTVTVRTSQAGTLSNSASVRGDQSDPNAANNTATATTTVSPAADLAVTVTDTPDPATVGRRLTYTIVVTNDGPSRATGVTLTDTLPKNAAYRSATTTQGTCSHKAAKGTVTCGLGRLGSGATATVTIKVKPTAKGTATNTASVTASSPADRNTANNTATATTTVK